ncbi:DUF3152 domain-containing protein [Corynebacterium suedekumii]|nr:DUF3152 domain-containing protein [Corynebacterium suedekumii]
MTDRSREGVLVRLARELGWRAYAIPVLVVITVWVLIDVFSAPAAPNGDVPGAETTASDTDTDEDSDGRDGPRDSGPNPADDPDRPVAPTELPPGGAYAQSGDGTYRVVGRPGAAVGQGDDMVIRYVVEVENGVDTAGSGGDDALAAMVDATFANPKGWTNDPKFRFEHVSPDDDPDMRIQLTSVDTTQDMCGGNLEMETSCHVRYNDISHVVINESRWVRGAAPFNGDVGSYRQYLINHEVGHGLGYAAHEPCGGDGELAPIMMQQTLSLNNSELASYSTEDAYPDDGATCVFNPWPYPRPAVL